MILILVIVLLVMVLGGYRLGNEYGHGALGLILLILLILFLTGNLPR